jgi:hypothetical protein
MIGRRSLDFRLAFIFEVLFCALDDSAEFGASFCYSYTGLKLPRRYASCFPRTFADVIEQKAISERKMYFELGQNPFNIAWRTKSH